MSREKADAFFWKAVAHRAAADDYLQSNRSVSDGVREWAIVMRFYAALHIVNSYLVTKDESFDVHSHSERERLVKKYPELSWESKARPFYTAFKELKAVSEQVRYDSRFLAQSSDVLRSETNLDRVISYLATKLFPVGPRR